MNKYLLFGFACAIGALSTSAWCVPGEGWELNKTVTMLGKVMPMPMIKLCLPKGAQAQSAQRELAKNDGCQISDVKTSGNKTTWKVNCEQDGKSRPASVNRWVTPTSRRVLCISATNLAGATST